MTGIYQITNKYNSRKYIGKSIDLINRWHKHISDLINNKHPNKYLQKDFSKYGYNGLTFEILDICTIEEMNNLELDYISELDSNKDYNIIGLKNEKTIIQSNDIDNEIIGKIKEHIYDEYVQDQKINKFQNRFNLTLTNYRKIIEKLKEENIIYTKNRNTYRGPNVEIENGIIDLKNEIATYLKENFKNGDTIPTGKIRQIFDLTEGQWKKLKNELNCFQSSGTSLKYNQENSF